VGLVGGGVAVAVASVPGSDGVIHACVSTDDSGAPITTGGNLRVIDPGAGQSCDTTSNPSGAPGTEENLLWNQTGPRGATGRQGPAGKVLTVAAGHTLTISGRVITVGGSPGLTINPPQVRGGRPVATLTIDTGQRTPMTFEIFSFSFGVTNPGAHAGAGSASSTKDIVITKYVDKASPKLALYCANGQHIRKATITLRKAGGTQPYLTYTLTNTLISSFQTGGHGGNEKPTEELTLNFSKLATQYK
jgi:type VI secretion system secreted protein Hcp